jgi:transcriptional regulator with XRE-family HTH domain
MGRSYRSRPKKLGAKLKAIRTGLGLTQTEMIKKLNVRDEPLRAASISGYELGQREPPLMVILSYSRLGNCTVEQLIDDKIKWP